YGRDVMSLFFRHLYFIRDNLIIQYTLGYYGPKKDYRQMKVYYGEASLNILSQKGLLKNINIQPFFRFEKHDDHDTDPLINQFSHSKFDKDIYLSGITIKGLF
ncbi:MAG: hypothetical protein ACK4TF_10170, partial [Thermodesulfovibrionales bacterium]